MLFGSNICLFFCVSTERNDQTEQEERREIKQRLNRKVGGHSDPNSFLKFHPLNPTFWRHTGPHGGCQSKTLIPNLLLFFFLHLVSIADLFGD